MFLLIISGITVSIVNQAWSQNCTGKLCDDGTCLTDYSLFSGEKCPEQSCSDLQLGILYTNECANIRGCYSAYQRCDNREDCKDGSDEWDCTGAEKCSPYEKYCEASDTCKSTYESCCQAGQTRCNRYSDVDNCFWMYQKCNGIWECDNGEDERDCHDDHYDPEDSGQC